MRKALKFHLFASIGLGLTLMSANISHAACESFEVIETGNMVATFVDHMSEGRTTGDLHIGSRPLENRDGEVIGLLEWVSTTIDPDTFQSQGVFILPDGQIHWRKRATGLSGAKNLNVEDLQFEAAPMVVLGGTGAYKLARGIITADPREDFTVHEFEIICD